MASETHRGGCGVSSLGLVKFFNTAGPCDPRFHHMLPPVPRLPEAPPLIDEAQYFVVHAPRQTGKTTTLAALARSLTSEGQYAAVYFSCETGAAAGDDYAAAEVNVLDALRDGAVEMGLLVIFDRRPNAVPLTERTGISESRSPAGRPVTVLRA